MSPRKSLFLTLVAGAQLIACSSDPQATRAGASGGNTGAGGSPPLSSGSSSGFTIADAGASNGGGCARATANASLLPANLLFIVDRSGSMNCNLPPTTLSADCEMTPTKADPNQPSKWEIIREAMKSAISALPGSAAAGITYFSNDNSCGVQSQPNVELNLLDKPHLDALTASLDAVQPKGGTPIVGAMINAYKRLNPNQYPNQPFGNKYVVLLTDGSESCNPEAVPRLLDMEAPKAIQAYIKTFVIGAPGSESARGMLSQLAYQGGTAKSAGCNHANSDPDVGDCHFDMTKEPDFAQALAQALGTIGGQALSCEFDVPQSDEMSQKVDFSKLNVQYVPTAGADSVQLGQDPDKPCDGGANGWQYADGNTKIVVCGDACDKVRAAASIDIVLGCATVVTR